MENATDALYIAFAVIVFVLALSVFVMMFAQLNQTSKLIISSTDITEFYEYEQADENKTDRIVGLETIIPTLYKYYKENYTVLFLDKDGNPLPLYKSSTDIATWGNGKNASGTIGKYYRNSSGSIGSDEKHVCTFDVDEELVRHEPWVGSPTDYKKNIDAFLNGGIFYNPIQPSKVAYNYEEQIGKGRFYWKVW